MDKVDQDVVYYHSQLDLIALSVNYKHGSVVLSTLHMDLSIDSRGINYDIDKLFTVSNVDVFVHTIVRFHEVIINWVIVKSYKNSIHLVIYNNVDWLDPVLDVFHEGNV